MRPFRRRKGSRQAPRPAVLASGPGFDVVKVLRKAGPGGSARAWSVHRWAGWQRQQASRQIIGAIRPNGSVFIALTTTPSRENGGRHGRAAWGPPWSGAARPATQERSRQSPNRLTTGHREVGIFTSALLGKCQSALTRLNGQPVDPQNVIHLRKPFGRAPLTLAREAIGVAVALERHAARLFGRSAKPSGALQFPQGMGEKAIKKGRNAWRATHEGEDSGGRTAILYDGATFLRFTFNSTDAQFLENRRFQIIEIARAFRVPPTMVYELDRATWWNDVLAYMDFPREHWVQIASTNPLERVNREIKRRADVIGIFPDDDAIVRLVGALMLETNDEWAVARRYMSLETLACVTDNPNVRLPAVAT